jgi:hypothetical protein
VSHPSRVDREATRRVLHEASAADGAWHADWPIGDEALDVETVVAAAVDAGIAESAVRRALAVERLGAPPARRRADYLLGPSVVVVDDELAGAPGELLERLDAWLVCGHHLRRDRLRGGRGVWRRRRGILGATFRTVRRATGEGRLGDLARVEAVAVDTGSGTSAVRIVADRRKDRAVRATIGAVTAAAGTTVVVGVAAVSAPVVLLATPLAVAVGTGVASSGRRAATDVRAELERLLDAVDHADTPARLGPDVVRRVIGRSAHRPRQPGSSAAR